MPVAATAPKRTGGAGGRGGFNLLLAIGVLDSGVRMGFLIFLPFLLQAKRGAAACGPRLTLLFLGGAAGKPPAAGSGRLGMLATVLATETGTAMAILAVLALPLSPTLFLLPLLGSC